MDCFDPLSIEFWKMVGTAIACGAIVGLERQFRGKPAGVRTSILICLGSTLFIRLGAEASGTVADPTRVLGQIVTGIGFLGAGVMFTQDRAVLGVTTAAVIWILAAIGAAIGFGYLAGALSLSIAIVLLLVGVDWIESKVRWLSRGVHARAADKEPGSSPDDSPDQ
jgi:putative Mg2+ transporter-C (MgtC) family protein